MKCSLFLFALLTAALPMLAARLAVIDGNDGSPLVAATVFGRAGTIVGMTDKDGALDDIDAASYPLTVKCLGFKDAVCHSGTTSVTMEPALYELGEMTVTPLDRPILRVLCYVREFTSAITEADTFQMFAEHMAHVYIPTAKVKGFKKATSPQRRRTRQYMREANSSRDSIYSPEFYDDTFDWLSFIELPERTEEPAELRNGARQFSKPGKEGTKLLYRKTPALYVETQDLLADKKNHTMSPAIFKLLGLTIDMTELTGSWAYRPSENGVYHAADILSGSYNFSMTARGKWIKKAFNTRQPVEMNAFFEIYPVAFDHIGTAQAKNEVKGTARATWQRSPQAPPLAPAIQRMVDVVTRK